MFMDELCEDSLKPLRVCNTCGKEAYSFMELKEFVTKFGKPYGVAPLCRDCDNIRYWKYKHPDEDINIYLLEKKYKDGILERPFYKRCIHCGFTIYDSSNLNLFMKHKTYKGGVANICKKCSNKRGIKLREDEEYRNTLNKRNRDRYNTLEHKAKALIRWHKRRYTSNISWYSEFYKDKVLNLYKQAKILSSINGTKYVIDHIYPINHPAMCGLNIYNNLQILESSINSSKANKLGYLYQNNCSPLSISLPPRTSRENVFNKLGVSMTYAEFLEYEKKHFKEYL